MGHKSTKEKVIRMKILRNSSGYYFVTGKGFVGSESQATRIADNEVARQQECIASCGGGNSTAVEVRVEVDPNIVQNQDGSSFAVAFVRKNQIRSDLSINSHKLNPSKRRFATETEAEHHARRFKNIEKHAGYFILPRRNETVNAYVNKVTGKTNPVIGKGRTNRG